ncbi:MAG: S1/P1 nuclease [Brumimicrobium sp.]
MKKLFLIGLVLLTTILFSNSANAWGMLGHRVVGEVASKHLSRKADRNIKKILGHQTLAEVSNWMDDIKSDHAYDSLKPWHYTTIPDGMKYKDTDPNPEGDVIYGINFLVEKLKSGLLTKELECEYLKLLVHLVGDIHQPLHVGNGEDRGGNDVKVEWFWEPSNIHRVWDSGMIQSKRYSYTELTKIINHPSKEEVKELQSTSVVDWAHEAMTFRDGIYDLPEDKEINYEYRYKHWDTMKSQLMKGGVRLAGLLNEIYG